MINWKARTF